MEYHLRRATLEDVDFLRSVILEAAAPQQRVTEGFDEETWLEWFGEWTRQQVRGEIPGTEISVIELGGEPAGRLRVTRNGESVELSGIQLLPRVQRRGIGTPIIEGLKEEARHACVPLDVGVGKNNPNARRPYERLGCVRVGEDKEEYKLRWTP